MAWVKRNLIFVIVTAIGLIATGYCGYMLYGAMGANAGVSGEYASTVAQLEEAQKKTPPPTKENVQAAKDEEERVKQFMAKFGKSFAPFPIAPTTDDRGFAEHLALTVRQFGAEATNAGVLLPPGYAFTFSQQKDKVSFPAECIGPWMQEIEELRLILHILYAAKINYLEQIQRIPAGENDFSGDDCIYTTSVSNQWGFVTPYKMTFRGFSTEVASVLKGFAGSSNCFLVKFVNVEPSRAPLPVVVEQTEAAPQPAFMQAPQQDYQFGDDGGEGRHRRMRPRQMEMQMQAPVVPAGPTPPETILQETPLYVTMVVDVVKLKSQEEEKPKPKPPENAARRQRPER